MESLPLAPKASGSAANEARLYLEWVRGAAGRFDARSPDDGPAARIAGSVQTSISPAPAHPAAARPAVAGSEAGASPPAGSHSEVLPGAAAPGEDDEFALVARDAMGCRRCSLCETRRTVVFGEGSRTPRLMVVGEAPGADEDASGRPFVGRAGQLLTRMLAAIGLTREDVYIANVLKCRPPDNRPPRPDEVAACRPFLREQMRLLAPGLVLVLGNHAARAVLGVDGGISRIRGRITTSPEGVPVLPTYHPAYLLRTPEAKREAWLDLQLAAKTLGLPVPERAARNGESA